ncbi:hypothetical protein X928_02765 [Petrotoga miotherma DSM 10691]|uniref:Uncharacterized protein n=1 Tax=Petrotoga miotherma DSM 10691 TaxID=1434326 RepID=A0A2K1PFK4_9BACT|nr:hypothetical protein X928_02765 [Petrotoga miotherma DSM 10691]
MDIKTSFKLSKGSILKKFWEATKMKKVLLFLHE